MAKSKITGATVPYQLRPHKAIERNLFIDFLKKLDASTNIDLNTYRYVGFGAAFLEDFKILHVEIGINDMDCIEIDKFAYSRQVFNNPFYFLNLHNVSSTDYITSSDFKLDKNQIIWLDYTASDLRQQLTDIELLCEKISNRDIIKLTFNSAIKNFIWTHDIKDLNDPNKRCKQTDMKSILEFLKNDTTFQQFMPDEIQTRDISNISDIIRAMAVRAISRGLSKGNKRLKFNHVSAFFYADGQEMTTLTGVVCHDSDFTQILDESKLKDWAFYNPPVPEKEIIKAIEITVPSMTVSERVEVDRRIPSTDLDKMANELSFFYGTNESEHLILIRGYHTFYKYLPYYSKVIY